MPDSLPDDFLRRLLLELDGPGTVGFALMGSHARGEAGPYSDVDLDRFSVNPPETPRQRYSLLYWEGRLVSVSRVSVAAARESLTRPEDAIWAVPGLRQARILLDRDGALHRLKEEAQAFVWAPLQEGADEYASYEVGGYAEEVHKVLSALPIHDGSAMAYATLGILLGLTRAVAVQRAVLISSENRYFAQVEEAVGTGTPWSSLHRQLAGYDNGRRMPFRKHGVAALQFYLATVELLDAIFRPGDREVVEATVELIRAALSRSEG